MTTGGDTPRPTAPPEPRVRAMFDGLVERYDLLNSVLSFGLDRWWRRRTVAAISAASGRILDLGCGSGAMIERLRAGARAVGLDTSGRMLAEARRRLGPKPALVQGSAFRLPFVDGSFDAAVSGFVLRNLDDLGAAFAELHRVLRGGGRIALVDITEPASPAFRRVFDAYFGTVAPAVGSLVGRRDAYRYLVHSLGQIPPGPEMAAMLTRAGFAHVRTRPLTGGIVTLLTGAKPE
jgi:demethylmenaquinone methyltransferase / 2-methoxy-6-polyprenyl-1,4-benzoquinol methylase